MTVYVDTSKQVGEKDHLKVFASEDAHYYSEYYISFRPSGLPNAIVLIAAFAIVSVFFAFVGNSFGYVVGFYSYAMLTGYLWLNNFSALIYNHRLAGLSAAASAIAFLLPALFISSPIRQIYILSLSALDRLLTLILLLSFATILVGASYSFKFVSIENIYNYRSELKFPVILIYVIGITSNALLPFAFACFVGRGDIWRATASLPLRRTLPRPFGLQCRLDFGCRPADCAPGPGNFLHP